MKKIILIVCLCCLPWMLNAQDTHLDFKGISITGTMKNFSDALVNSGCERISPENYFFKGEFIDKDCLIAILGDENSDLISGILILFDTEYKNWDDLRNAYYGVVKLYQTKYGTPTNELLKFYYPYERGDGYEITAIAVGKCKMSTTWQIENGSIVVYVTDDINIGIVYKDKKSESIVNERINQSHLNEI